MFRGDAVRDGQAQAGAVSGELGGEKWIENIGMSLLGDARSVIHNRSAEEGHAGLLDREGADVHFLVFMVTRIALVQSLSRIGNQI